ncbi:MULTISPECIES: non-ribosomal peptide synthetase [unclassified Saccharopolyspora]|uniref:non-ribosomal peptide synthetase n=1 Tax=unclassified Saccharopolyspora TaxID=2646250 RepID=UPI001CD35865|nr:MULTISPECIES: non-ribosomal peptide synthetase [unclassified Saccharopolyspora]MCA1186210.1 amino acid adenylation domain-containing protein [Saccharopolyspora sp. 6T]MCA1278413.1 amino acid adenylation domain-containing protein [Saccharopolyspora sp. 7B]
MIAHLTEDTARLLQETTSAGFTMRVADGRLRLNGASGTLPDSLRAALSERREELLAQLGGRTALPLSGVQRRLWFLQQLDESGVGYTFTYAYRLRGEVDPARLRRALNAVLAAHPGLSAVFVESGGKPIQLVDPSMSVPLTELGPSEADPIERLREAQVRPFDLDGGPLLRSTLVPAGDDEWLWAITYHHLICDGWTHGCVVRQLANAYREDGPAFRPEADYSEFVLHDLAHRDDPKRTANLEHWVRALSGVTGAELPTEHPRPALRGYRGAKAETVIDPGTVRALTELATEHRTTPFSALLSAHAAVLAAHTGHDQVIIGTPHANRPELRFQDTAGCFVSTLALPVDLSEDITFRQLLERTAEETATAWDHRDFSYETLVERLVPQRDTARNALFQTFFALQDAPSEWELPGVTSVPLPFDPGIVQFDLEFHLTPGEDGSLALALLYNRDLYERATAEELLERWRGLVEHVAAKPDVSVHRIPVLRPADLRIINAVNDTAAPVPGRRVDLLIADQAALVPEDTAVECGDQRLTYAELEQRVGAAAALLRRTCGSGERVGLLLPRSVELVIALLATWRIGATAVPLPLDLPEERLAAQADSCSLRFAWTSGDFPLPAHVQPVDPSHAEGESAATDSPTVGEALVGEAPAYVLFTSGSTGEPKGVQVGHEALLNLLAGIADSPGLGTDDVLLSVTAPFFDIALLELLLPLMRGARLVVATEDETRDPRLLADRLDLCAATTMQATPSTWRMLVDTGWAGRAELTAWCGGEPLSRDLANALLDRCSGVWNLYGPTETTIWSARWKVLPGSGPVLVGEPVNNTTLHVLGPHGTPLPPGAPGELHIAGTGLADGYLGNPELTEQRFTTIEDENGTPRRAYRTGDLALRLGDGTLRHLGRTDDQMKVRGHRIEPEEIERAVRSHPDVRDCVVLLADSGALIAHVQPEPGFEPEPAALAAHTAASLRPVLVPQHYVLHPELPRTPNGKKDRKALRGVATPEPSGDAVATPPGTREEILVAEAYQQVLDRDRVGRDDDFFASGGHSLAAVRVLHLIEEASGVRLPLHVFMRDTAVSAVAAEVLAAGAVADQADADLLEALGALESLSDEEVAALLRDV